MILSWFYKFQKSLAFICIWSRLVKQDEISSLAVQHLLTWRLQPLFLQLLPSPDKVNRKALVGKVETGTDHQFPERHMWFSSGARLPSKFRPWVSKAKSNSTRLLGSSQGKLTFCSPEEGSSPAFHCSSVNIPLLWGCHLLGSLLSWKELPAGNSLCS